MHTGQSFGLATGVALSLALLAGRAGSPIGAQHAGHSAHASPSPAIRPSPEAASATARPGQPAATLKADALDVPPPVAVQEAARAAELAAGGHSMDHGTYRQVDAGRPDVPVTSPRGEAREGSAPPSEGDPHAGHGPAPRPSPSPAHEGHR